MNDLHSQPPFQATQTVELLGGPFDGERWKLPINCSEFHGDAEDTRYRFCPHASARFDGNRFIHQHIEHDFYAR